MNLRGETKNKAMIERREECRQKRVYSGFFPGCLRQYVYQAAW